MARTNRNKTNRRRKTYKKKTNRRRKTYKHKTNRRLKYKKSLRKVGGDVFRLVVADKKRFDEMNYGEMIQSLEELRKKYDSGDHDGVLAILSQHRQLYDNIINKLNAISLDYCGEDAVTFRGEGPCPGILSPKMMLDIHQKQNKLKDVLRYHRGILNRLSSWEGVKRTMTLEEQLNEASRRGDDKMLQNIMNQINAQVREKTE